MQHIAWHVKQQGKVDVDHYFTAMDAMNGAGKSSSTAAGQGKILSAGWVKDLALIGVLLQRMCRAKTLEKQLVAYHALQGYTSDPHNTLCLLLQHAGPVMSLDDDARGAGTASRGHGKSTPFMLYNVGEKKPPSELKALPEFKAPTASSPTQVVGSSTHTTPAADGTVPETLPAEPAEASNADIAALSDAARAVFSAPVVDGSSEAFSDNVVVADLAAANAAKYEEDDDE